MQKILLLTAVLSLSTLAMAQPRSTVARKSVPSSTQQAQLAPDAQRMVHPTVRRAPGDLKAMYKRPAGVFYNPLYTRDSKPGSIYGYNAPQLHAPAYVPITYVNMSTGADEFFWQGIHTVGWSKDLVTSSDRDFTIDHPVVMADSVPTLEAYSGWDTAIYYLQGYNATPEVVRSVVWTYPYWQYGTTSAMQERHAWETSKYGALRHTRFDSEAGASSYYTMDAQYAAPEAETAYFVGRNTRGYDYAAIAFEKPDYPYLINHVGVRYQGLKWTEAASSTGLATITATIYALDRIPDYSETTSVSPVLGEEIASGSTTLSAAFNDVKDILSIPVSNAQGESPEITDNILVVITGYNDDDIAEVTLTVSNDNEDEGYGELGYVGVTQEDGSVEFHGLNNFLRAGMKSAPSIYIETERPWLTTNSGVEPTERNFAAEGENYTVELFAYRPLSTWTKREVDANGRVLGNVPAWVGLTLSTSDSWDQGCTVNATFDVDPLPAGTTYREAIIRFAYPGARFDYKVTQGTQSQTYAPGDVDGNGVVDIEDVNALINVILESRAAEEYGGRADVNSDGNVDIEDANALINLILNQ
ncbi:MAG: hypothetical protein IKR25_00690 [Muribaculaceae bacterium]|nr:hypothetical protein [Muribaculaceae bacterium]